MRNIVALVVVAIACSAAVLRAQEPAGAALAQQLLQACKVRTGPAGPFSDVKAECQAACSSYLDKHGSWKEVLLRPVLRNCIDKHAALDEYMKGTLYRERYHFSSLASPRPPGGQQVILFSTLACPRCLAERAQFMAWGSSPWAQSRNVASVMQPLTWGVSPSMGIDYDAYALIDIVSDDLPAASAARVRSMAVETRKAMPLRTSEEAWALLLRAGVEAEQVAKFKGSFSIQVKLRKAQLDTKQNRINSPRAYVVNGKYVVPAVSGEGEPIVTNVDPMNIVQFLVQREVGEIGEARK